jgi:hypothetical protein
MANYWKFPSSLFKTKDMNKYRKTIEAEQEEDGLDEIDKLVSRSARNIAEEDALPPRGIINWMRVPISILEDVVYESISSVENQDEEFETEKLSQSIMYTKDGEMFQCAWDVETLEKNLIKIGVVSPSILDQKEEL